MYTQSLMLAMTANGLASCAQGALSHYAAIKRRELGVAAGLSLIYGLAFGYEEISHAANAARTDRAAHLSEKNRDSDIKVFCFFSSEKKAF